MTAVANEGAAPLVAPTPVSSAEKQRQVEALLSGLLKEMSYPATLDFKEMPDGGLGVAVHFDGDLPGIVSGKRSYLVDCIQFLVNKVVNRPHVEKRWVTLGVNAFPEPRAQNQAPVQKEAPTPTVPAVTAPRVARAPKPGAEARPAKAVAAVPSAPPRPRHSEPDEKSLAVEPTAEMTALGQSLAAKAARFGRFYAVTQLSTDDRARVVKAAQEAKVTGATVKVEGEGYFRRVTFVPEKPVVIAKKQVMPDYDDEG